MLIQHNVQTKAQIEGALSLNLADIESLCGLPKGYLDNRIVASSREFQNDSQMECFVYILGSSGKNTYQTYVGWTINLDRRLAEHNSGKGARSTRGRFWTLLYVERHATRRQAMSREWHLKRDRRFRKLLSPAV